MLHVDTAQSISVVSTHSEDFEMMVCMYVLSNSICGDDAVRYTIQPVI